MSFNKLPFYVLCIFTFIFAAGFSCDGDKVGGVFEDYVKRIVFTPSGTEQGFIYDVAVEFTDKVKVKYSKDFPIKSGDLNYGNAYLKEYIESPFSPFIAGLKINEAIFKDEKISQFVDVKRTRTLPNGKAMDIGYDIASIQGAQPVSEKFDIVGYADPTEGAWIGASVLFFTGESNSFPLGLTISQDFAFDAAGKAALTAYVYGATAESGEGTTKASAIAVMANVKALGKSGTKIFGQPIAFTPVGPARIHGEHSDSWSKQYNAMKQLENRVLPALDKL